MFFWLNHSLLGCIADMSQKVLNWQYQLFQLEQVCHTVDRGHSCLDE